MKLSIITINYNNLDGLKKTAESVLAQSWRDFEWIIIDGASTDGSREYIIDLNEELAQNGWNPISYWCSEPDKGIFNAMNKGIAKAKGEYLNFMNSGDYFLDKDTLGKVAGLIAANNADVFYGDCVLDYGERKETRVHPSSLDIYELIVLPLCHQAMFFSRSVFKDEIDVVVCVFDKHGISTSSIDRNVEEYHNAIEEIVPKHIMSLVSKLYRYDKGHIYNRVRTIENKGGLLVLILRLYLKLFG